MIFFIYFLKYFFIKKEKFQKERKKKRNFIKRERKERNFINTIFIKLYTVNANIFFNKQTSKFFSVTPKFFMIAPKNK